MEKELPLFNRDLSWLSFNQRILEEAAREDVPLLERIRFLAIYSSNLDEFYRVRMPLLSAIKRINRQNEGISSDLSNVYKPAKQIILDNQARYGQILQESIIPALSRKKVYWVYQQDLPEATLKAAHAFFRTKLAPLLEPTDLDANSDFFPINNRIYCILRFKEQAVPTLVHIPEQVERFYSVKEGDRTYILFIDDILRKYLPLSFPNKTLSEIYTFKVTRDADLDFNESFEGDLAQLVEEKVRKREFGLATRLQYQPGMPGRLLQQLMDACHLRKANVIEGGNYHNMKDLFTFPLSYKEGWYPEQIPLEPVPNRGYSLFSALEERDTLISTPYESYDPVLLFFKEAATDASVEEIYTTIYRVAKDSKILQSLMRAAKNGKKVTVFVELRARFDETNNIKWARQLQKAGVDVLYSFSDVKVHAKIALIKRREGAQIYRYALLSTGNLNEQTSETYADHILLSRHPEMTGELEALFLYLIQRKQKKAITEPRFTHLLVAPFNLEAQFMQKIDREIASARAGKEAKMLIKLNNLEDEAFIRKLYEAAQAGVKVNLIVRSICRLVPGIPGYSETLQVRRLVDRYLEHSRLFVFYNNGQEEIWMGSADWMRRNIHHRIEVCFPIYDPALKKNVKDQLDFQLQDDQSAVYLDSDLRNIPVSPALGIRAQMETYLYLQKQKKGVKNPFTHGT